jgi:hypothetical protein
VVLAKKNKVAPLIKKTSMNDYERQRQRFERND